MPKPRQMEILNHCRLITAETGLGLGRDLYVLRYSRYSSYHGSIRLVTAKFRWLGSGYLHPNSGGHPPRSMPFLIAENY